MNLKLILVSAFFLAIASLSIGQVNYEKMAKDHLDLMVAEDFAKVVADFDGPMTKQIDEPRLEQIWNGLVSQLGSFEETLIVNAEFKGDYIRTTLTSSFEKGYLKAYITYNKKGLISGLFFSPEMVERSYSPPDYVDKSKFSELEYRIRNNKVSLPAVLSMPNAGVDVPLLILVHGSGPLDRDLSIQKLKPFKDLAWGLASKGIAVLRYDKRTFIYGAATAEVGGGEITPQSETIDDVVAALQLSGEFERIDRNSIYVFGHSLGAMLAAGIEKSAPGIVKGYVLSAGSPRNLEQILLEQYRYVLGLDGLEASEKASLKEMKAKVKQVKKHQYDASTANADLLLGVGPAYWDWLSKYDATGPLLNSSARLLILHADKDYQIIEKDLKAWKKGLKNRADVKRYTELFHPLIETKSSPLAKPSDYNLGGHVPEYVISDLWKWIKNYN